MERYPQVDPTPGELYRFDLKEGQTVMFWLEYGGQTTVDLNSEDVVMLVEYGRTVVTILYGERLLMRHIDPYIFRQYMIKVS